ncbi:MAG: hypothetical protein IPP77_12405 [Bacteroidetes bacterium]|nr:hypothetical protein [Bacteroidota bacterium]
MTAKRNYFTGDSQPELGFKLFLKYCSIGLLVFLFSVGQRSAFANSSTEESNIKMDLGVLLSGHSISILSSPLHLPFESTPNPQPQYDPTEKDSEDDLGSDCTLAIGCQTLEGVLIPPSGRIVFSLVVDSLQNRSTVPLFILYHSWKSFLS